MEIPTYAAPDTSVVHLSRQDLKTIELALRVLLQSSTREEHVFRAIRETLGKIEEALRRPGEPKEAIWDGPSLGLASQNRH